MKFDFTSRFITLKLRVVKALLFESRWFEAVKYTIALTKLLSYFLKKFVQGKLKQPKKL